MYKTILRLGISVCVFVSIAQAESAVFWVSAPVEPGQAVLVTGYFPDPARISIKAVRLGVNQTDWHSAVSGGPSVQPLKPTENSVAFLLPNEGGVGVYGFSIDQPNQPTLFERVNLPEIWWTLADVSPGALPPKAVVEANSAAPGTTLRIVGRCLAVGGLAGEVLLIPPSGRAAVLKAESQSPYSISVKLPSSLAPGRYALRIRDASGGESTSSQAFAIQIHESLGGDIKKLDLSDFGSVADGKFDNTTAFHSALAKASVIAPAIVVIPAGGYFLSQPLEIPPGVYLSGASSGQTALYFPDVDPAPAAWIYGTSHFGLLGITVFCGNHKSVISSDMSGSPETSGHIRIHDVRVVASALRSHITPELATARITQIRKAGGVGFETIRLSGPDIVVEDSDILGSSRSLILHRASGAIIRRTKLANGIHGWYNVNSSENLLIEDNVIEGADLLASGGSYSTFGGLRSRNIYTAGNSYSRMLGWDREAFTSDAGGGAYFGGVSKTEGLRLTLSADPKWGSADWQGAVVAIISGHGQGQWRPLKAVSGAQIELTAPFLVAPDSTSKLTIVPGHIHYVFYKNRFQDAGVAIQLFGTAVEHIVAENESSRAGGFRSRAMNYYGIQPQLNVQFLGNRIVVGNSYHFGANNSYQAGPSTIEAVVTAPSAMFGMVFRNNVLNAQGILKLDSPASAMKGILVEGNKINDPAVSLQLAEPIKADVLLR